MLRSLTDQPAKKWLIDPVGCRTHPEIPMLTSTPTFNGLANVASHLRNSFAEIGLVIVERVVNRNDNTKVASIELSPEALRAFLPVSGPKPTDVMPDAANEPLMRPQEQQEAMLAWLRHTFAANMEGKSSVKFKVGLWTPKREALVRSVRVAVSGLPPAPEPPPAAPAQTWELLMPNGERIVTSDPDIVEAHRRMLESSVRGMVVFGEQVRTFLELMAHTAETDHRQAALEAKARIACGYPPDHDWLAPSRSNVIPFQGSPKS